MAETEHSARTRTGFRARAARLRTRGGSWWTALSANMRGAIWVVAAAVFFSAMAALAKFLGGRFDSMQVAFFRALTGLVFILPFLLSASAPRFVARKPLMLVLRGASSGLAMLCGFYALTHLPLADATAITFVRALFLVPLAVLILHETVGVRRISATTVGFIGVLIMVNPAGEISVASLVALAGAALVALSVVLVKMLTRTESTLTLLFYSGVFGMLFTAVPAAYVWRTPGLTDLSLLMVMGVAGVAGHACFIRAYAIADATALAPLDYTRLLFAGLIGYLFFAEVPGPRTALGAAIIVASTFYITYREAKLGRARDPDREY